MTTDTTAHTSLMHKLREAHQPLLELLTGKKIHYLDIPLYENVGDLLIMLGTHKFLKKNDLDVIQRATVSNTIFSAIKPHDIILCQGGGNFGDLYPLFQRFREEITRRFPSNEIIVLPQTIHFSNQAEAEKSFKLFAGHKRFHLCVRDKRSFVIAKNYLPEDKLYLLPDMAHQLYPLRIPSREDRMDKLYFLRNDFESSKIQARAEFKAIDWGDVIGLNLIGIKLYQKIVNRQNRYLPSLALTNLFSAFWIKWSWHIARISINTFTNCGSIETDRLHGHILACLLDKKNTVIDNSYGKNHSYLEQWTFQSPLVNRH